MSKAVGDIPLHSNNIRPKSASRRRSAAFKRASIIVVAKVPTPGSSKTRLIPELGDEGAAKLAEAMLVDVLSTISFQPELDDVDKILLFAPPGVKAKQQMQKILSSHGVPKDWSLLGVHENAVHLKSSELSTILQDALQVAQSSIPHGPVVFLGMDSPQLPVAELIAATQHDDYSLLCPAADGGYGLLSVPSAADVFCFSGVLWSHPLTALSQLKALSDQNINVRIGPLMYDIDDEQDLLELCERLKRASSGAADDTGKEAESEKTGCLSRPSSLAGPAPKPLAAPMEQSPPASFSKQQQQQGEVPLSNSLGSWFGGTTATTSSSTDEPRPPSYVPLQYTKLALIELELIPDDRPPPPPDTSCADGILADLQAVWSQD